MSDALAGLIGQIHARHEQQQRTWLGLRASMEQTYAACQAAIAAAEHRLAGLGDPLPEGHAGYCDQCAPDRLP